MQQDLKQGEINDYVLRLSGKVSLLEPIELDENYKFTISGTIISQTDKSNQDGTFNREYRLEPIIVELLDKLGRAIKSKDPRSKSKLLRACLYRNWKETPNDLSDEEFYDLVLNYIIANSESLAHKALQEK